MQMDEQPDLDRILAALHLNTTSKLGELSQVKEPKVSLPNKFDGNRSKFRGTKVGFIGSLLSEPALAWFVPLLKKQSPVLSNFDNFVQEFESIFGDPDKVRTAANKIRKLTQGEAALIDQFRTGLRDDIKDLLLTMDDPTSLNDAISKAVDAIRLRTLTVKEKRRRQTNNLCLYCSESGHFARNCPKKSGALYRINATDTISEHVSGKEEPQLQ
ncbi:3700_t:CDS:2 [Cetraspora pellucida]|uniref:3700_t:CDS:1 n=1 Tax=Cetraspora pellucida TaxID=1433469 RepID=A0A9N9G601_9GLOM|nr:3700_t:CDS:2 [Cetraspora pellucida]